MIQVYLRKSDVEKAHKECRFMIMTSNERIVRYFWQLFDAAGNLLQPNAIIRWWNSREEFKGADKFIEANRIYPGRWRITVERLESRSGSFRTILKSIE